LFCFCNENYYLSLIQLDRTIIFLVLPINFSYTLCDEKRQ